jgi:hypothetical protein
MIRSVIAAIKNSYKPLCKQESDNENKTEEEGRVKVLLSEKDFN